MKAVETKPSEDELREIFAEERGKLGLSDDVEPVFIQKMPDEYYDGLSFREWWAVFNAESTGWNQNDDGTFFAQFNPLSCKSSERFRSRARHELYHIAIDGPVERMTLLRYIFYSEPAAMIYAKWGLKL